MKQYRLIKEYPWSPELWTILNKDKYWYTPEYKDWYINIIILCLHVENNPDFFEEVKEEESPKFKVWDKVVREHTRSSRYDVDYIAYWIVTSYNKSEKGYVYTLNNYWYKDYDLRKPTEEELKLGMEVSSQYTGLIYLTFMVFHKLNPDYIPDTRYGTTRSGTTRGSSGARFGYGNEASSASVKSDFEFATGTERYVLPVRLRIADDSVISNSNCSQHLKGANLNALRRQTMTVPF